MYRIIVFKLWVDLSKKDVHKGSFFKRSLLNLKIKLKGKSYLFLLLLLMTHNSFKCASEKKSHFLFSWFFITPRSSKTPKNSLNPHFGPIFGDKLMYRTEENQTRHDDVLTAQSENIPSSTVVCRVWLLILVHFISLSQKTGLHLNDNFC